MVLKNWLRRYWNKLQRIWKGQEATFPYFEDSGALTSVRKSLSGQYFELVLNSDILIPAQSYYELPTGIRTMNVWGLDGLVFLGVVSPMPVSIEEPLVFIPEEGLSEFVIGLWNRDDSVLVLEEGEVVARVYFLSTETRRVHLHASR